MLFILPPSWAEWVGFGPVRQQQSFGPVFTKTGITQPAELQTTCRQLHMKVDFTIFPSIYNTWVGTIEIGTEFTMNLEVKNWTATRHLQLVFFGC